MVQVISSKSSRGVLVYFYVFSFCLKWMTKILVWRLDMCAFLLAILYGHFGGLMLGSLRAN